MTTLTPRPAAGLLLACLAPMAAFAESADQNTDVLPAITVTADPFDRRDAIEATQATSVLAEDALERARSSTLGDTLANQPGVHNADFSSGSGRPVIRGQSGPRVRILNGGSAVSDASTLSPDHNVAIEPFRARQIEVLKGPASLLYGSGAIGGVINVVSDLIPETALSEPRLGLGASWNSVNQAQTYWAHGETQLGPVPLHIDALDRSTKDYDIPGHAENDEHAEDSAYGTVENSSQDNQSVGLGIGLMTGERGTLGLGMTRYTANYGVPGHAEEAEAGPEPDEHGDTRIELEQTRIELRGSRMLDGEVLERLKASATHSEYKHQELEGDEAGTVFRNDAQELRLEISHKALAGWRGVAGMHSSYQDFAAVGDEAVVPPVTSQSHAVFLVEEREFGPTRISFGTRLEHLEHEPRSALRGGYNLLNVSGAAHHDLNDLHHFRLGVSYSQRAPDVQELYSLGPHLATRSFDIGDGNLDKETAKNLDLGWHADFDALSLNLDLFYTDYQDFIFNAEVDRDGDGVADYFEPDHAAEMPSEEAGGHAGHAEEELLILQYQQADARFFGAELELGYHLNEQSKLTLFADFVRGERESGIALPRIPAARVGLGYQAEYAGWDYGVSLIQVMDQTRTASLETATDGYALLSADLAYTLPIDAHQLRIRLRGRNLLDEDARNHISVLKSLAPLPGRNIGISLEFDF